MISQQASVKQAKQIMLSNHGITLHDVDIYIDGQKPFISTRKAAELFRTVEHNFSNSYVRPLISSGVKRIKLGRNKYYSMTDILERLKKSINQGKSIFEICDSMKKKKGNR